MKKLIAELQRVESKILRLDARNERLKLARKKLLAKREFLKEQLLKISRENNNEKPILKPFAGLNLTSAILKLLEESKTTLTPAEIHHQLNGGGFVSKSKNFYTNVYVMCRKLAQRNLIREFHRNYTRRFARKTATQHR